MSFDFQLAHGCPHLTIEEEVVLGADRRELLTRQPVASSSRIRITANDDVTIPPQGLLSQATLSGSMSGPFRIIKNENTLTVSNRTQSLEDFSLPIGSRVETSRIVNLLNAAFRNNNIDIEAVSFKGSLGLIDRSDRGLHSQIKVSGPAKGAVGFVSQTRSRGRKVYPSWEFAERPSLTVQAGLSKVRQISARFPKFTEPVKGNPVFKVTYTTYQEYCRRCQSFGIENDWRLQADGSPRQIENEDLLNQDALKILSTIKGSNPFHPEYGTTLLTRIGTKAINTTASSINEDVTNALSVFQRLQGFAGKYQEISSRQRLASVLSINTTPSDFDPTIFEVTIVAANAANVPVVISTVFAAPGTVALAGTNGLSLGLEGFGVNPTTRSLPGMNS